MTFLDTPNIISYDPDRGEKLDVIVKNCVELANKNSKEVQTTFLDRGIRVFPGDNVGKAALRFLNLPTFTLRFFKNPNNGKEESSLASWEKMTEGYFDNTYGQSILFLVSDIASTAEMNMPFVQSEKAIVEAFKTALPKRHRQASAIEPAIKALQDIWRYGYLITPEVEKQLIP